MKKIFLLLLLLTASVSAQVPVATQIQILKAEDARAYDGALEALLKDKNEHVRVRAALAAGRIGDEKAVPALIRMLNDTSPRAREMAAFALGEIESMQAADAIRQAIGETARAQMPGEAGGVDRGRLVEAAGKIAAANAKDPKAKELGQSIIFTLEAELQKGAGSKQTIMLALTAVLRARPEKAEETVRKFLAFTDPDIVANALNTLARLRAKNANRDARDLLATHVHAVVRANAARLLGAAEDKEAIDVLIKAATTDTDQRVRVAAIRALGSLKDSKATQPLRQRGEVLLGVYKSNTTRIIPKEQNEFIEIAATLGKILPATPSDRCFKLFNDFLAFDQMRSTEVYLAGLRGCEGPPPINDKNREPSDWRGYVTIAQMYAAGANTKPITEEQKRANIPNLLLMLGATEPRPNPKFVKAGPDLLRAYAAFKPEDLEAVLREHLVSDDVWIRATAAELLAENAPSTAIRLQIENAFKKALTTDKHDNDAQLAMLDAMAKINKAAALDTIYKALDATDYLVRKKALELLDDPELITKYPGVVNVVRDARARHKDEVWPYDPKTGTKLGQVLNTDADYRRARSRRNSGTRAIVTTEKGTFTIDLLPEDAPLTVDNFIRLARSNYFNGVEIHRVVPNFVMQDGDPRGDGNGGPGWSIRCEINMVPYERGAVGMALSGKDTGGSQWFVTHSPQPHLDGGYTVFGKVNDAGMKVVDNIVRGDKILLVRIVEAGSTQRSRRTQRRSN